MKETFATTMPDRIGAFLQADRCISRLGLNITRVSYNKAVDTHMLFIEVEGEEEKLERARAELDALGYLREEKGIGSVILLEFKLKDEPGALLPVLELIHSYRFNISYISSQENGTGCQLFKMGLFVDDGREISDFMKKASFLCPIRIIEYNKSEKVLDNTVFYITFANGIAEKMGLDEAGKKELCVNSNLIMQFLDERSLPPYKTFDYIGRFADTLLRCRDSFDARMSRYKSRSGREIILCEPPCGSNVCVIKADNTLVYADCGFSCYAVQTEKCIEPYIADCAGMRRELLLTHADADHCGFADTFDAAYMSESSLENFEREKRGEPAIREEEPLHAPYVRISKLLTAYRLQDTGRFIAVGGRAKDDEALFSHIGTVRTGGLTFEAYEGKGGHVRGECVFVEREEHIAFTGDIFVNIKGFTPEQRSFNRLAPYLMTAVDTDPDLAAREREELFSILGAGEWQIFGGHGAPLTVKIAPDGTREILR